MLNRDRVGWWWWWFVVVVVVVVCVCVCVGGGGVLKNKSPNWGEARIPDWQN